MNNDKLSLVNTNRTLELNRLAIVLNWIMNSNANTDIPYCIFHCGQSVDIDVVGEPIPGVNTKCFPAFILPIHFFHTVASITSLIRYESCSKSN